MIQTLAQKLCERLDASPRIQKIIDITPQQEKIASRFFLPALAAATLIVMWSATAFAEAEFDSILTIHEVAPVLTPKRNVDGASVNVINQVDVLIQLPGEHVARRFRVPVTDTLFLDPHAPAPGERTYDVVIGIDGRVEE